MPKQLKTNNSAHIRAANMHKQDQRYYNTLKSPGIYISNESREKRLRYTTVQSTISPDKLKMSQNISVLKTPNKFISESSNIEIN